MVVCDSTYLNHHAQETHDPKVCLIERHGEVGERPGKARQSTAKFPAGFLDCAGPSKPVRLSAWNFTYIHGSVRENGCQLRIEACVIGPGYHPVTLKYLSEYPRISDVNQVEKRA